MVARCTSRPDEGGGDHGAGQDLAAGLKPAVELMMIEPRSRLRPASLATKVAHYSIPRRGALSDASRHAGFGLGRAG